MDDPTIVSLVTIGGIATVVGILLEVVKRLFAWTEAAKDRFAPALALVLGIGVGVAAALAGGTPLAPAVVAGLYGGAVASGIYSLKNFPA